MSIFRNQYTKEEADALQRKVEEIAPAFFLLFKEALRRFEEDAWKICEGDVLEAVCKDIEEDTLE